MSSRSVAEWDKILARITTDEPQQEEQGIETIKDLTQKVSQVPAGMFVSGWDDPENSVVGDTNPKATPERYALWAASENKFDVLAEIIAKEPSVVHAVDEDGYTPLHKACYNNNKEMALLLLRKGANPNARTEMGWTPLHSACKWNYGKCAATMLQHGADINAYSNGQQTPLHIATTVSSCRDTLVTLLMDDRIEPERQNNSQETALQLARRNGTSFPIFSMAHAAYSVETGLIE